MFFARTISLEARPSVIEDVLNILDERVLPIVEGKAGMVSAFVLVDRVKGKVISVTFWESEEAMRADESGKVLQRYISALPYYVTPMLVSEKYEVAIQAAGPAAPKAPLPLQAPTG